MLFHSFQQFNLLDRDIALRNCIITKESIVKLTTVSLCKDKHANEYFKHNNRMIPLRHLAPETLLSSSFSTASDVFASAVTIWEILNSGALPFESIANEELLQSLQNKSIDYGQFFGNDKVPSELQKTLVSPKHHVRSLLNIHELSRSTLQLNCWSIVPSERPTPDDLIKVFDSLMATKENGDTK